MAAVRNLIIDTDVGCDAAVAIALALVNKDVTVHAITTVFGNVPMAQATHNVAVLLKYFNQDSVPFFEGASHRFCGSLPALSTWPGHGHNGLGGHDFYPSAPAGFLPSPQSEGAASALARMARERPGFYDVLALGPLTNIAAALALDPSFAQNIRSVVWMGGSAIARGNASPTAEFNALADPAAAAAVVSALPARALVVVPWEATAAAGLKWGVLSALTPGEDIPALAESAKQAWDRAQAAKQTPAVAREEGAAGAVVAGGIEADSLAEATAATAAIASAGGAAPAGPSGHYSPPACGATPEERFRHFLARACAAYWAFSHPGDGIRGAGPRQSTAEERRAAQGQCCPLGAGLEQGVCGLCAIERQPRFTELAKLTICDAAALVAVIAPIQAITGLDLAPLRVDATPGSPFEGTLVVDWYSKEKWGPPSRVVRGVKAQVFADILAQACGVPTIDCDAFDV